MKKQILSIVAVAAFALTSLSSCVTVSSGAALTEKGPIGQKVGEAKSSIILGIWSSKGEQNNLKEAAKNGGITKVSQVEYIDKAIFLGLVINRTTRVYGE